MKYLGYRLAVFVLLICSGCFAKVQSLPWHTDPQNPIFEQLSDPDILVGIAVSGGGSRAATFAAGALEALAGYEIEQNGARKSLLEATTHMSSVSGGSLATAYYALNKPGKDTPVLSATGLTPEYQRFFAQFQDDMQINFQLRAMARQLLMVRALNPTKFAHSLADVWDSHFFQHRTFEDLYVREQHGDSPRIILNGTIYNTGRRLALTTLGPNEFSYDFAGLLKARFEQHLPHDKLSPLGQKEYDRSFTAASTQFMPQTFEALYMNHRQLPLSLAVASSASFPPIVGPVTYEKAPAGVYAHVGDGGLFDNLGTESLATLFLKKVHASDEPHRRGIIIVIDSSFPFAAGEKPLMQNPKGFDVFADDPSRIVGIMEARANAYQTLLWQTLRSTGDMLPPYNRFKIVVLRHVDAEWTGGYNALPEACHDHFNRSVTPDEIKAAVSLIPTLFKIENNCHAALLISAAKQVVAQQRTLLDSFFPVKVQE